MIQYRLTFNNDSMKLVGFIIVLFLSVFTFGQSAKKVNTRLREELTREQQKQDSVYQVFLRTDKQQKDLKNQFGKQKERFIRESSNTLFYRDSIKRIAYNLKRLGQDPDLKDVETYMEMSNGWYFLQDLLKKKKEPESFESVSGTQDLNGMDLKKQNELLKQKIAEYQNQGKANELRMQQNESGVKQLESGIFLLDSATIGYENATKILLSKKKNLDKQLNDLRETYRLKGPAGFPVAYRTVFPDVHPIPKEEVTNDPDSGDFRKDEGFTDIPVPVESSRVVSQEPEIFTVVEEFAEFPGGMSALKKYLTDNLRYPERAREMAISGKVFLQFVVSTGGQISNVKLLRGLPDCKECDTEAIRLVKTMPNWKPGKNNGKTVNSYFNLPVEFKLNK